MDSDLKSVSLFIYIVVLLVLAIICLVFPRKVQSWAIRALASSPKYLKFDSLSRFVQSKYYLFNVRAVGLLAMLSSAFLLWMAVLNS